LQNRDIGIFDSGIGGLTVLREFLSRFPAGYNIHYVGDTARAPYGSKPPTTIVSYARGILNFLLCRQVKAVICACNTSDSLLDETDKTSIGIPYFSTVKAFSRMVDEQLPESVSLAIIATENTVKSGSLLRTIVASDKAERVMQQSCRLFVPVIEKGIWYGKLAESVISHHLSSVKRFEPEFLVMGCTHYPFLEKVIREYLGASVEIIDPGLLVVDDFAAHSSLETGTSPSNLFFYVSGDARSFRERLFRAEIVEDFAYTIRQLDFLQAPGKRDIAG